MRKKLLSLGYLIFFIFIFSCKREEVPIDAIVLSNAELDFGLLDTLYVSFEEVQANIAFSAKDNWTAQTNDNWIALSESQGSAGDVNLSLAISENQDSRRVGEVNFSSQNSSKTITVIQDSLNITPELILHSNNSRRSTSQGDEFTIVFYSNLSWTASANEEWIQISANEGGKGENQIEVVIPENQQTERNGIIKISDLTENSVIEISIIQDESGIYFVKEEGTGDGYSWEDATGLTEALSRIKDGGIIHVASGRYVPSETIANGDESDIRDNTFEINKNITIKGGYSINSSKKDTLLFEGKTVLSGLLNSGENTYHVVAVTAPRSPDKVVHLKDLTIQEGNSNGSGTAFKSNGVDIFRNNGAGVTVQASEVLFENVDITDNEITGTTSSAPGVYLRECDATFVNCKINNNRVPGGAFGAVRAYRSDIRFYNSEINDNISVRGTAAYLQTSNLYMYNTEVGNNIATSWSPGIYITANSVAYIVNSIIHHNKTTADGGGGLFVYSNSIANVISSTIVKNEVAGNGGGILRQNGDNKLNIFNSIISGNIQSSTSNDVDAVSQPEQEIISSSIIGSDSYNRSGVRIPGTFDVNTNLNNVFVPIGSSNPAYDGMDVNSLKTVTEPFTPPLEENFIEIDKDENKRLEAIMGYLIK